MGFTKVFPIQFDSKDAPLMRAFPVGLALKTANSVLEKIRQENILVRFELNDSRWSKKQKVIYLPLGPHMNYQDIQHVAQILLKVVEELRLP